MKLYKLSQNINHNYDTYDSCVVCAKNKLEAKTIRPSADDYSWLPKELESKIGVEYLGEAKKGLKKGIVIASFNAG